MSDDMRRDYGPAGACRRKASALGLLLGLCVWACVRAIRRRT